MAITLEHSIKRFRGLSTDEKPGHFQDARGEPTQKPPDGSTFTEIDTGRRYIWFGGEWTLQPQTLETLLQESISVQREILAVLRAIHQGHELYQWEASVDVNEF